MYKVQRLEVSGAVRPL